MLFSLKLTHLYDFSLVVSIYKSVLSVTNFCVYTELKWLCWKLPNLLREIWKKAFFFRSTSVRKIFSLARGTYVTCLLFLSALIFFSEDLAIFYGRPPNQPFRECCIPATMRTPLRCECMPRSSNLLVAYDIHRRRGGNILDQYNNISQIFFPVEMDSVSNLILE